MKRFADIWLRLLAYALVLGAGGLVIWVTIMAFNVSLGSGLLIIGVFTVLALTLLAIAIKVDETQ